MPRGGDPLELPKNCLFLLLLMFVLIPALFQCST
jgi:hypothetical protein